LPLERVILSFIGILPFLRLVASTLDQRTKTLAREIGIAFVSIARTLLECVQHIDSVVKFRYVEHSVFETGVNPDLFYANTHGCHWLPIVRLKPLLDPAQLKPGNPAGVVRKPLEVVAGRSEPNERFVHIAQYAGIDILSQTDHSGVHCDKISKRIIAIDLPIDQPMNVDVVINLKPAKQIGLTIPPNVLARADRVIK
jgi:hypothetical protein